MPHLNTPRHEKRVLADCKAADLLEGDNDEWAVVCFFYAAFHAVRIALLEDARLDSDVTARAVHPRVTASSRHVDFHNGHPSRGPGVNQLVGFLYPELGPTYLLLHERSVEVRYESGITAGSIADVRLLMTTVFDALRKRSLIRF